MRMLNPNSSPDKFQWIPKFKPDAACAGYEFANKTIGQLARPTCAMPSRRFYIGLTLCR